MGLKDSTKIPVMERFGIWYLKKLRQNAQVERIDSKVYLLDDKEREEINRIEKKAIYNAVIAGIISTIASGLAAFLADPLNDSASGFFQHNNLLYYSIVFGVTILASVVEIFYIYYDVMIKTHQLTVAAHMELFCQDDQKNEIGAAIVRGALELPNKMDSDLRIDPRRESSKLENIF